MSTYMFNVNMLLDKLSPVCVHGRGAIVRSPIPDQGTTF